VGEVPVAQEVAIARERRPDRAVDDDFPVCGESRRLVASRRVHQARLLRRLREHLLELPERRLRRRFRREVAEPLSFLEVRDLAVDPRPEIAPARERLRARSLRADRLDARDLRQPGLPAERPTRPTARCGRSPSRGSA
jgi:hypothetical protein